MEWHIRCAQDKISRYVFCPGSQTRAKLIADSMDDARVVSDSRGYIVFSGTYKGVFMTSIGTGMGGPTVAIALEELAHMGTDTLIRVGSCGVFLEGQSPGDVIIASGTARLGGTANNYLPLNYPAVPTFSVLRELVATAETLEVPHRVGVGLTSDAFYRAMPNSDIEYMLKRDALVSVEMESDTLFILGAHYGWRTGALYVSDGSPGEIKPEWGAEAYREGEQNIIAIALEAMVKIAMADAEL